MLGRLATVALVAIVGLRVLVAETLNDTLLYGDLLNATATLPLPPFSSNVSVNTTPTCPPYGGYSLEHVRQLKVITLCVISFVGFLIIGGLVCCLYFKNDERWELRNCDTCYNNDNELEDARLEPSLALATVTAVGETMTGITYSMMQDSYLPPKPEVTQPEPTANYLYDFSSESDYEFPQDDVAALSRKRGPPPRSVRGSGSPGALLPDHVNVVQEVVCDDMIDALALSRRTRLHVPEGFDGASLSGMTKCSEANVVAMSKNRMSGSSGTLDSDIFYGSDISLEPMDTDYSTADDLKTLGTQGTESEDTEQNFPSATFHVPRSHPSKRRQATGEGANKPPATSMVSQETECPSQTSQDVSCVSSRF